LPPVRYFYKYRNGEQEVTMKRMHLHVGVPEIGSAIEFYSTLFDAAPTVVQSDYAKWMLEDPRVNFAVSARGRTAGVDHVGIQTDTPEELQQLATRLKAAGATTFDQEATTCCYARSDKSWVSDTAGVRWETSFTHGDAPVYGEDESLLSRTPAACSGPAAAA
jgi:hypothetical protein